MAKGDVREANEIAKEQAEDLLSFAENTPVVGHITSGIHAIRGDTERARQVALGKSLFIVRGFSHFRWLFAFSQHLINSLSETKTSKQI